MKQFKFFALLLITFLVSTQVYAGGGWPQPKGFGFFKLSQYMISAHDTFGPNGNINSLNGYRIGFFSTSLYGEYGFTNRLTGIVYAPVYVNTFIDGQVYPDGTVAAEQEELSSFGDVDLAIKYGLINNQKINIAATLTLGIPSGEGTPNRGGLTTGDGEFNQMLSVDASKSFQLSKKVNLYGTATIGFNKRSNKNSNELRYGAEAGIGFWKIWYILRLGAIKSLNNFPNSSADPNQQGVFGNNIEYVSLGHEIAFNINENFGVSAGYAGAFSAKKILAAPSFTFGVYYNLRKK